MRWCIEGKEGVVPQVFLFVRTPSCTFINDKCAKARTEVKLNHEDRIQFNSPPQKKIISFKLLIPQRTITKKSYGDKRITTLYNVTKELGTGAFGKVYLAKCASTNRDVAIKEVKTDPNKADKHFQALFQEISTNMSLGTHPCIIKIEKVIEQRYEKISGKPQGPTHMYIVMEPAIHGDLFGLVTKIGLTEAQVRIVFDQIFHGTAYLHRRGVVHRDLKLENIVITDINNLHVKICDFGLATFEIKGSILETVCGTKEYAAPELISNKLENGKGKGYTKAVDIWSLGVMLYSALLRHTPFKIGRSDGETLINFQNGIHFVNNQLSNEVQDLLKKMLTYEAEKRPTIEEVLDHPWMKNFNKTGNRVIPLQQYIDQTSMNSPPITPS
ncbi:kinase-like domain-containing protein [Cunninghamella echinulata]|nr:kinase-like domain-containing protein [Cunninghamella echinulata]